MNTPPQQATTIDVAMYLRMSTESQKYSIANQEEAITAYADLHGMSMRSTYRDEGKSGLRIENRKALKALLQDVQGGKTRFKAILVYDVSRWGRFQNTDQAAYYDYLCRMHGIEVIYVAEMFANDDSPFAAIFKNLKRAMAGEYSRELSVKCKAGQVRLAGLGYAMGGPVAIGTRRLVLDDQGQTRSLLRLGERKAIQSDHVILVPGPPEEVALVRRVFKLFAGADCSITDIVRRLKLEQIKDHHGNEFSRATIRRMLSNEAYIGNNVWGRRTLYLGNPAVHNPPDTWIRKIGCYEPIVAKSMFAKAHKRLSENRPRMRSREELLDDLRSAVTENGDTSIQALVGRGGAGRDAYRKQFGSLTAACHLIGYCPDRSVGASEGDKTRRQTKRFFQEVADRSSSIGAVTYVNRKEQYLNIDNFWQIGVAVAYERAPAFGRQSGRWRVNERNPLLDILIVVRVNADRTSVNDFFVVPRPARVNFPAFLLQLNEPHVDALRTDVSGLEERVSDLLTRRPLHF
jgi:DNA invertase Pin-like site-specific DNA recombinase